MKTGRLERVPLDQIDFGDRAREDLGNLQQLASKIDEHGLIHPITLLDKSEVDGTIGSEDQEDRPFLLMAGGRRFMAHKEFLDAEEIEAKIYEEPLSDLEIKSIELMENMERKDLDYGEEIMLKKQIHDMMQEEKGAKVPGTDEGHSKADTAEMLGESPSNFNRDYELAEAAEEIPELASQKNKSSAWKMLKKAEEQVQKQDKAKEVKKKKKETPREQQMENLADAYIVMDFFEGVENVDDAVVDFVEIDPPYAVDLKTQKREGEVVTADYNEIAEEEYAEFMQNVLAECYRVMKGNSWLIVWFGPEPWFEPMYEWITDAGFHCKRLPGIWTKPNGQTQQPQYNLANTYEMFFYARKGSPSLNQQGRSNQFPFKPVHSSKKEHPTERPIALMEEVLTTFCHDGARVMVPFAGSGNTLLASWNLNLSPFGFDLNEQYKTGYEVKVWDTDGPHWNGEEGRYVDP